MENGSTPSRSGSEIMAVFFTYLDELAASGEVKMEAAKSYIEHDFGLSPLYAKLVYVAWGNSKICRA